MSADAVADGRRRGTGTEGRGAGRGRQRTGGPSVEGTPRPAEDGDVQEPREVEPEDDQDDAADRPKRRKVVDQRTGDERGGDAEDREDGPEAGHVRECVPHREPARGCRARSRARDRDRRQLTKVGGHQRQDARRQEADDARGEGDEDGEVRSVHRSGGRSGVQDVGEQPAELGRTRREFEAAIAEHDDRDRREVRALPVRVGLDVTLDERRDRQASPSALLEQSGQQPRARRRTGGSRRGCTGAGRGGERRASRDGL